MPRRVRRWMTILWLLGAGLLVVGLLGAGSGTTPAAEPLVIADFTRADHGWRGNAMVTALDRGADGTVARLSGDDPYVIGPVVALPAGAAPRLRLHLEAATPNGGEFRLFHAAPGRPFTEDDAVQLLPDPDLPRAFSAVIPMPAEPRRFRLDPPAGVEQVVLRRLVAEAVVPLLAPPRPAPVALVMPADAVTIAAGGVAVRVDPHRWNALVVDVEGTRMADADPHDRLAVVHDGVVTALGPEAGDVQAQHGDGVLVQRMTFTEAVAADGVATWSLEREVGPGAGGVRIVTRIAVDRPRDVVHLPWLTLIAGLGSFGDAKTGALLPGVEYLEDEPSSNDREIRGPAANRRLVAPWKVCLPMMAVAAADRWLALDWEPAGLPVSPLFDSPDRIWHAGGHLLGLWSPAVGRERLQGELEVQRPLRLAAGRPHELVVRIRGGRGGDVALALADRVARDGLPAVPVAGAAADVTAAGRLLAHGWLDSAARDGLRWRHAVWSGSFPPQPAEDAPTFMLWLAEHVADAALATRLRDTAGECILALPPDTTGRAGVGHAGRPVGPLLFGDLERTVREAGPAARRAAARLAEQGGHARYTPGTLDLASTLGADHANGLTAIAVEALLEQATLTGDEAAIAAALEALTSLDAACPAGVPRGAQPWEMPLHTPDILAAARLVRCFVLGHLLTGDDHHLGRARAWAWRGATMVYLAPPTPGPVGLYATIGVIGATHWTAPNWIGQPVQWCGLVYAAALQDLARIDPHHGAAWHTLASGITRAGLQMTFPADDPARRGGLLPDYWLLVAERGDGPAINPGTLQASLAEAFAATPLSTMTRLATGPARGGIVHVAGAVRAQSATADTTTLDVDTWPATGSRILVTRCPAPRRVTWNGKAVIPRSFTAERCLTVPVPGDGRIVIEW